ncbi:LRP2-binding protein-like [Gigantopelta aegis]|uniref:LRP2-binding protein-like n=1 Tax=Gigantopelta aegis TaxID=1735272 RepID=UPI001B88E33C|nr:LRP2-binding protein-like [Gigantopelta aegis]
MELKNKDEVKADRVHFSHENKILTDLVQQARDSPTLVGLTDDQLLEKVENILLEKIQTGDKQAYFQLGLFYYEQEKYLKARVYFERSKKFDYQSMYMLAVMWFDGIACEQNSEHGVEYLMKIATCNSKKVKHLLHSVQFNIGRAYFQGYGVKHQSDEETEKWWLLAADDGNPSASVKAQSHLGMFYSREETRNLKLAFFWHSEACGNGSLESQGALGVMYEHGVGVKKCLDAAYICLKDASDRGNVYAMGNLVSHYYKRKMFTKAADLGSKVAELEDIDTMAEETECLPSYIAKGISIASFFYARCLAQGLGTMQDKEKSEIYYSRSYEFDPDACAHLQNITQHGLI